MIIQKLLHSRFIATILALGIICTAPNASFARPAGAVDIKVEASKISNFVRIGFNKKRFGKLEFLGGLVLESNNEQFGGLSSVHLASDQKLLTAITDKGFWFHANLVRTNGVVSGITDTVMTTIVTKTGGNHTSKWTADAEGLEISDNTAFVSFERNHRVERFTLDAQGFAGRANQASVSFAGRGMKDNQGIEAIALAPSTSPVYNHLIAFPESLKASKKYSTGFLIRRGQIYDLKIRSKKDFRITDATFLPNGDLLVLERLFDPPLGVRMRIQRIKAATIGKGKKLSGDELINVGLSHNIDNMEGISASTNAAGETIISLVSDDNFNSIQRTLYLEFKLVD